LLPYSVFAIGRFQRFQPHRIKRALELRLLVEMKTRLRSLRRKVRALFDEADLRVGREKWYFDVHVLPCTSIGLKLAKEYGVDEQVVEAACLLHDVGLIGSGTENHEKRSAIRAAELLKEAGINDEKFVSSVQDAIASTALEQKPHNIESKVVRTADAMAHMTTLHYYWKAHLKKDFKDFESWFKKKIEKDYAKICFKKQKKELQPAYAYLKKLF